jgi:Domain of unknown function (DUF4296)
MVLMKKINGIFILVCASILFYQCGQKEEDENLVIPNYVLPHEQFVKITYDMALAESASALNVKNIQSAQYDSTYAFNPFKDNKVSKQQYDTSIYFYSQHPKLYKKILEEVLAKLSETQSKKQSEP